MSEKICTWLAWKLPRRVVYWASVRLGSSATVQPWENQVVPELTVAEALNRWER